MLSDPRSYRIFIKNRKSYGKRHAICFKNSGPNPKSQEKSAVLLVFLPVSCLMGRLTNPFGCAWYSTTQFHISSVSKIPGNLLNSLSALSEFLSRFAAFSRQMTKIKKDFGQCGLAPTNQRGRWERGNFLWRRSLVARFHSLFLRADWARRARLGKTKRDRAPSQRAWSCQGNVTFQNLTLCHCRCVLCYTFCPPIKGVPRPFNCHR